MPLSWNEIKDRALRFSREWEGDSSEDAEAKSFWDAFFDVFGVPRRRVASFENPVRKSDGQGGYIDLLWKGTLVVEHKSRGKNLDRAYHQATDYFSGLKNRDLPRFVLVSDFARFRLYDLDDNEVHEFRLEELHKNLRFFDFIAGYQRRSFAAEDPVNIKAAEKLGELHDQLRAAGYVGHPLEVLLVRLLFCLFADDTGIFETGQLREYLDQRTAEDGSDLGMHLAQLFQVLNTAPDQRQSSLDQQLAAFAYINGRLFQESLPLASFNRAMRETLLDCCAVDWSGISPAIFGSLFQSIMDPEARRNLGAHYTREVNILKALQPLFLDAYRAEFDRVRRSPKQLLEFQAKLASTKVLDPACGCGNFLVIAYRELRLLELEVLREIYKKRETGFLNVSDIVRVDVDQFYGIEIEEFPAQIAQVALWLTDHQMNGQVSEEFGQYFARLPLVKSPNIVHGNALRMDWSAIVGPTALNFIVGNPPFVGAMVMSDPQRDDIAQVFVGVKGGGILDYVSAWYVKAARYLQGDSTRGRIRCAFVSTNSIAQGEQVGVLWRELKALGVHIHFAHRTFRWSSEATGRAAVHCVIIGFGLSEHPSPLLFDYETPDGDATQVSAGHINPYLVDGPDVLVENRSDPMCPVPGMRFGSMPRDGGHLILSPDERDQLLAREPSAAQWVRQYTGAEEFLNGGKRYCLWLVGASPDAVRGIPFIVDRLQKNARYRLASKATSTQKAAARPGLFVQIAQPESDYLLVPRVSSERRLYLPIGFMRQDVIANDQVLTVAGATLYHFGGISSAMHMAWMRYTCGRLESRYRYSKDIVYNNFPWPDPTDKQRQAIETASQVVLDARAVHPGATLADLYDPLTMPVDLLKAHQALDRAVDLAYGKTNFQSEAERVAFLFERYEALTSLLPSGPARKKKRKTNSGPARKKRRTRRTASA